MQRIKNLLKKEDGVSMVIVALMLTVLLGMAGLALDVGCAYYNRTKLQAACDAAALAAAQQLLGDEGYTEDYYKGLAKDKGIDCFDANFTPAQLDPSSGFNLKNEYYDFTHTKDPTRVDTVTTTATMTSETVFAKILGFDHFDIKVTATAFAYMGTDDNIGEKNIISDLGPLVLNNIEAGGVHSNGDINFTNPTEAIIHGDISTAGGDVVGEDSVNCEGRVDKNSRSLDFDAFCGDLDEFICDKYINSVSWDISNPVDWQTINWEFKQSINGLPARLADGTLSNVYNSSFISNGRNLVSISKYGTPFYINENTMIIGDLSINANTFHIKEGCTLYVLGNANIQANTFICDGNLYVTGNISTSGNNLKTSNSKNGNKTSYIFCKGKTISLGLAGAGCNNMVICAPNCDEFTISGSNTNFTGSLYVKQSQGIGNGGIKFLDPDKPYEFLDLRKKLAITK